MTARPIGVGVLGVGWMGRLHARSYRAVPERYPELEVAPRLVLAADPDPRNAREAVERLGFGRAVADPAAVLADPEVDVVSICSPNALHRELAVAAAEAGKPFWIEKPMGRGAAESAAIVAAAERAGVVTAVGFNYRHAPAVVRARQLVQEGAIGRVTHLHVRLLADYAADPRGALTWRFQRAHAGTGVLGDLLSHGIDLAHCFAGPMTSVTGLTQIVHAERPRPDSAAAGHFSTGTGELGPVENEDYAAFLGRFEGGAVGTFEASRVDVGPRNEYVLEVFGTRGSIRWDFERMNELQVALAEDRRGLLGTTRVLAGPGFGEFGRFQPGAGVGMGFDDLKVIEAAQFLRSVLTGVQCAPSVQDGLAAAEVASAVERSAETAAWVDVPAPREGVTFGRTEVSRP